MVYSAICSSTSLATCQLLLEQLQSPQSPCKKMKFPRAPSISYRLSVASQTPSLHLHQSKECLQELHTSSPPSVAKLPFTNTPASSRSTVMVAVSTFEGDVNILCRSQQWKLQQKIRLKLRFFSFDFMF